MSSLEVALACGVYFLGGSLFATIILDISIISPLRKRYLDQVELGRKAIKGWEESINLLKEIQIKLGIVEVKKDGSMISPIQIMPRD